jgi:hypothetical protein
MLLFTPKRSGNGPDAGIITDISKPMAFGTGAAEIAGGRELAAGINYIEIKRKTRSVCHRWFTAYLPSHSSAPDTHGLT